MNIKKSLKEPLLNDEMLFTNFIGGVRYHKKCVKCATCGRKLDSRSLAIDKGETYCTVCLKKNRIAGQDTPKIHPDVTCIATRDDEKGCPRYKISHLNELIDPK